MTVHEETLKLKRFLLYPKRSDKFTVWLHIGQGFRPYYVEVGNKRATLKAEYGKKITMTINKLKEALAAQYWSAARLDATIKAWQAGKRRRSKGWEKDYA